MALGLGVSLFVSSECPPDSRIRYTPLEQPPRLGGQGLAGFVVCLAERRRTRLMRSIMSIAEELGRLSPLPLSPERGATAAGRHESEMNPSSDRREP